MSSFFTKFSPGPVTAVMVLKWRNWPIRSRFGPGPGILSQLSEGLKNVQKVALPVNPAQQLPLFVAEDNPLVKELRNLNLNELTPLRR